MNLILASSSPYRRELLARLRRPFETIAPNVDEAPLPNETPAQLVQRLSLAKARAVAVQHPGAVVIGSDQIAAVVDAAPSIILGKPGDRATAVTQLRWLSGRRVQFLTGLCVIAATPPDASRMTNPFSPEDPEDRVQPHQALPPTAATASQDAPTKAIHPTPTQRLSQGPVGQTCELGVEVTEVAFRSLTDTEIAAYVDHEQPFGCAAAFRSERLGITLVESIRSGDPSALIGLPLIRLCDMLRRAGLNPLEALKAASPN